MKPLINALRYMGIDRAISYTIVGRAWSALAGPITLLLIARLLPPREQGFYYTFGSVIALNVFLELGLTYVILQFASHERAHLLWTPNGMVVGPAVHLRRLAALLKMALRWYGVASLLALTLVTPAGLYFFSDNAPLEQGVIWRTPWLWLVAVSALNLFISPLFAILEGCGKISHIASLRVSQGVISNLALWVALLLRSGLYAAPVFQSAVLACGVGWLLIFYRAFFADLLHTPTENSEFNWRREVWPFQWRIALSWLSGYFIFQLFNPVLFATQGAAVAGQMGMSLSLCSALLNLSISWVTTKASPFGILVAKRDWAQLDFHFFQTLRQSIWVLFAGSALVFCILVAINIAGHPFAGRLLRPLPFALLLASTTMNHVLFCEAQYLRHHKAEPFVALSVSGAVLTCILMYLLAKPYGALGVSAGYLTCCAMTLIWGTIVFSRKRREWHADIVEVEVVHSDV